MVVVVEERREGRNGEVGEGCRGSRGDNKLQLCCGCREQRYCQLS